MDIRKQIMLSSVPFIGIDEEVWNISSCFLIDYRSRRIMITAAHAALGFSEWAILTKFSYEKFGTHIHCISTLYNPRIADGAVGELRQVDFCYAIVNNDYQPIWQEIDYARGVVLAEEPKTTTAIVQML